MDGNSIQKCEREKKDGVAQSEEMHSALSTLWVGPSVVEKYRNEKGERKVIFIFSHIHIQKF
jgi:hypothetical protein